MKQDDPISKMTKKQKVISIILLLIMLVFVCIAGAINERKIRNNVMQINPTDETFNVTMKNDTFNEYNNNF